MHQRVNIKSNSMQEAMVVTCMQMEGQRGKLRQKMVELKSNTIYRTQWRSPACRMWKMAKIKSNSIQNIMMLSCMQKKVKLESNSLQKIMWITCTQKKVNIKSNTVQNTCM